MKYRMRVNDSHVRQRDLGRPTRDKLKWEREKGENFECTRVSYQIIDSPTQRDANMVIYNNRI